MAKPFAVPFLPLVTLVTPCIGVAHLGAQGLRARAVGVGAVEFPTTGVGALVKPMTFNRQLLICDAYASSRTMAVSKNGQRVVGGDSGLKFGECRNVAVGVLAKDKLDFMDGSNGIQGTFEVGDLPDADVVLLLVLQRRDQSSPLLSFQSFAFPMNTETHQANLAVIDASAGLSKAHLQVRDVPAAVPKDAKPVVPQTEELSFNRIYALDQGGYSIALREEDSKDKDADPQSVYLSGKQNYVVLRTMDQHGQQKLVAFPHEEITHSGAAGPALLAALLAVGLGALA